MDLSYIVEMSVGAVLLTSDQLVPEFIISVADNPNTAFTRHIEEKEPHTNA